MRGVILLLSRNWISFLIINYNGNATQKARAQTLSAIRIHNKEFLSDTGCQEFERDIAKKS
jgi:hypothetical protein